MFADTALLGADDALRQRFFIACGIPDWQRSDEYRRCNGVFGAVDEFDDDAILVRHKTWFIFLVKHVALGTPRGRSLYWWSEMMYFTNHDFSTNERIVVCFDAPEVMRRSVTQQLMSASPGQSSTDIYDTHVLLLDAIQTIYEKSVWTIRTAVRNIERSGLDIDTTETDFPYLHETARHAIHSAETLGVAVETISNLCLHHEELQDSLTKTSFARKPEDRYDGSEGLECRRRDRDVHCVRQQLRFHLQMMKSLHARSVANSARLQNQLTLAFNIVTQRDSRATVSLGRSAMRDSAAMKTIAYVTLVFLPATFVSAIFSTSFFTFASSSSSSSATTSSWAVSPSFWIYWAVAVPLTLATLGCWFFWERRFVRPVVRGSAGGKSEGEGRGGGRFGGVGVRRGGEWDGGKEEEKGKGKEKGGWC